MSGKFKLEYIAIGLLITSILLLLYNLLWPNKTLLILTRQYDINNIKNYLPSINDSNHILFFYDFSCNYCREMNDVLNKIYGENKTERKIRYINTNVEQRIGNFSLALGAQCADKQHAFFEYSKIAYNSIYLKDEKSFFERLKNEIKLNHNQFFTCIKSDIVMDQVNKDTELSAILKVDQIPTLAINGFIFEGNFKKNVLKEIIKKVK